jgi:hypothetical protein
MAKIRILVVIIAFFTAYVFYSYIFEPQVMSPLCLVNSNQCARMGYYAYNNSALIHMRGSDIWVWFNGDKAYVYGQPVGQICKDPSKYQAAYVINTRTGIQEGYECVIALGDVITFYTSKGVSMEYLVARIDTNNFDIYSALNMLNQEGVINIF